MKPVETSSLGSLVKTLVDNGKKTVKNLQEKNVDKDKELKIVDETGEEGRITKDMEKDYPDKIEKSEELINVNISDSDLKFLRTDFPDNGIHKSDT